MIFLEKSQNLQSKKWSPFDGIVNRRWHKEMRSGIDQLKAAIQSHVSKQIVSRSGSSGVSLEEVKLEIHSFTEMVKKMEKLVGELYRSLPEEEDGDGDAVAWSPICFNMVGLSDLFNQLKPKGTECEVLSVVRMGGIGKTTLAIGKTTLAIGKTTLARDYSG